MTMWDYYCQETAPQWDIFMDMRQRGIRVDRRRLDAVRSKLTTEVQEVEALLNTQLGWIPNTRSWKDMGKMYEQLGIKLSAADRTATGRPKSDEDKLLIYANRYPTARDVLNNCIEIQTRRTRLSGFLSMALDPQDFYHPGYDPGHAVTGRCSSTGADEGGPQIQNIPQSLRHIFIPDDDESEFTQADLSQAEARVVAWDAQDPLIMEAFRREKDVHRVRACILYRDWNPNAGLPEDEMLQSVSVVCPKCSLTEQKCNHSERQVAKTCGHAFAYKMGIRKLMKILRKLGVFINESEAERIKSRVVSPALARWQDSFWRRLQRSPWLETPLGRRREFYGLLDEDMVREALSWFAQATISQITNRAMIKLFAVLQLTNQARIVTQTHDSILLSHKREAKSQLYDLLNEAFHCPMTIHDNPLLIPIDKNSGPSWGELH